MKTLALVNKIAASRRVPSQSREFIDQEEHEDRSALRTAVRPEQLVESEEYEWTTPLGLPGLLVAASESQFAASPAPRPQRNETEVVVETEDGDAMSAFQLPGRLSFVTGVPAVVIRHSTFPNELADEDEYTEAVAKQLPGQLVFCQETHGSVEETATVHGLCATCLHQATCDFPKPAGGVWQCEEYA